MESSIKEEREETISRTFKEYKNVNKIEQNLLYVKNSMKRGIG